MCKPSMYLVVTYFHTYLPIYDETYFLQNWLVRWNQILTQLRFIHNWVIPNIQMSNNQPKYHQFIHAESFMKIISSLRIWSNRDRWFILILIFFQRITTKLSKAPIRLSG
jgi:hypothetical protein